MSETPTALAVPFSEVGRDGAGGVALVEGWTVLWGQSDLLSPSLDFITRASDPQRYATGQHLASALAAFSANREVYFSISDGTSGTYGLDYYANGQRTRSLWELDKQVVRDNGQSLPGETEFRQRLVVSEWGMIELLCHLTLPYSVLEGTTMDLWRIAWVPEAKVKPRWHLW